MCFLEILALYLNIFIPLYIRQNLLSANWLDECRSRMIILSHKHRLCISLPPSQDNLHAFLEILAPN